MDPIFTLHNVSKSYPRTHGTHGTHALEKISFTVKPGEFLVLLGPSGSGKSTLLRMLAGLDAPSQGHIVRDEKITPQKFNFVFQSFALLPWLSALQNVELGLIGHGVSGDERTRRARAMLERFGLLHFASHRPHELSGGMQQRVGLARAFATEPKVLFLDEPFSELDFYTAENLRQSLLSFWAEKKSTVIMVSHYIEEAASLSDRIIVFSERPGTVAGIIENSLPRPRHERTSEFFAMEDKIRALFTAPA